MWEPNKLERERLDKAVALEAKNIALYPARSSRSHTIQQALNLFETLEAQAGEGGEIPQELITITGRIRRTNIKGKVSFMHIEDESGRIQLFLRINELGEADYELIKDKLIELDDIIEASGYLMRTRAGEISVHVHNLRLLSKALSPLPLIKKEVLEDGTVVEHGGFTDVEQRYRQRYADLAVNESVRDVFRKRALIIRAIQNFLDAEGMLEVETPILQPIYGGAAARPFVTHHNQLHQDLFLRISFELYLKRLLVGMYDAVYEIGRDFRNEGVSFKHNPEFTMLEFYKAYTDLFGVMDIVERMTASVAERVHGSHKITYQGQEIDLTPPWRRASIRELVLEATGIDYYDYPELDSLRQIIKEKLGMTVDPKETWGRIVVEHLFANHVEPHLIQPTFVTTYPRDVSPFAKQVEGDEKHVERFEVFIGGMEMGNAFTELNDPRDQEARFLEMAELYRDDADDATPLDEDYLKAMRYGMPPSGGFGLGVDRLVMLLTDQRTIKDVLLFPHLREQK